MRVGRHLRLEQGDELRATGLAEIMQGKSRALARMHRSVSLHIRQGEGGLAVATVSGPQEREERCVLRDRQELAGTKGPAFGREVERKDSDFSYKWIGHKLFLLGWGRENSKERDNKIYTKVRLKIIVGLAAARRPAGLSRQGRPGRHFPVNLGRTYLTRNVIRGAASAGVAVRSQQRVTVRRDLLDGERHCFGATSIRQVKAVSLVKRDAAAQIGQRERLLTVAAISGADQVEERFIFRNRQQLPLTKHPSCGSKVRSEERRVGKEC